MPPVLLIDAAKRTSGRHRPVTQMALFVVWPLVGDVQDVVHVLSGQVSPPGVARAVEATSRATATSGRFIAHHPWRRLECE
jgi:hypothetical protein